MYILTARKLFSKATSLVPAQYSALISDTFVYGVGSVLTKLISVLLAPIILRVLSPDSYGMLDVITTTSAGIVLISSMSLESAVARYFYDADGKRVLSTAYWFVISSTILVVVPLLLAGDRIAILLFGTEDHVFPLRVGIATVPIAAMNGMLMLVLRLRRKRGMFVLLALASAFAQFALTIILVVFLGAGVVGVLLSALVVGLAQFAMCTASIGDILPLSFDKNSLIRSLAYSLPLVPSVALGWFASSSSRYFLLYFLDLSQVGIFAVAVKIASFLALGTAAFQFAWYPYYLSMKDAAGAKRIYAVIGEYAAYVAVLLGVTLTLFSDFVVNVVGGEVYSSASPIVGFLVCGVITQQLFFNIFEVGLVISERTYLFPVARIVSIAVNIACSLLFVKWFGIAGAALSVMLTGFTLILVLLFFSQRYYRVPYPLAKIFSMLGIQVLAAIFSYANLAKGVFAKCLFILALVFLIVLLSARGRRVFGHILQAFKPRRLLRLG